MKKIIFKNRLSLILAGTLLVVFVGCSKESESESGSESGNIAVNLQISELQHTESVTSRLNRSLERATDNYSSTLNYVHPKIDGFRIKLLSARLGNSTLADFSNEDGKTLEIGDSYSGSLTVSGGMNAGVYSRYSLNYKSEYDIKAWGRTATKTCYTKVTGIVCENGVVNPDNFTNYDFFHYDFFYLSTSHSPTSTTDSGWDQFDLASPITINDNGTSVNVQLLIDTFHLVQLWDGTGTKPGEPFCCGNNHGYDISDFYPDNTANIAIGYIPMHLSLNDSGTTEGEVYAVAHDNNTVSGSDLTGVQTAAFVFQSNKTYVGSRMALAGGGSRVLEQFQSDFTAHDNGTFSFYNGACCKGESWVKNWDVVNFKRTAVGDGAFEAQFKNGPDCYDGTNPITSEHGQRNSACHNPDNKTIWFKRVK